MKMADVLALTNAKQRTVYSWMKQHPTVAEPDPASPLGQPFPKPVGKEGREVVWDEDAVRSWWEANEITLGRYPSAGEKTVVTELNFIRLMQDEPIEDVHQDRETGELVPKHPFSTVEMVERIAPGKLRLTFRNVSDAVAFKLMCGR